MENKKLIESRAEIVSPREAAHILGIRLDCLYSLIWAGRLKAEKQDGRWLVSRTAVAARMKVRGDKKRRRRRGNNGMDAQERGREGDLA